MREVGQEVGAQPATRPAGLLTCPPAWQPPGLHPAPTRAILSGSPTDLGLWRLEQLVTGGARPRPRQRRHARCLGITGSRAELRAPTGGVPAVRAERLLTDHAGAQLPPPMGQAATAARAELPT